MTGALRERLLALGSRPALIDEDGAARSGAELVDRVERLAGALTREGLAGERVGVWYANCFAAFEAYLAIEWIGATRVVLDPGAAPAEAAAVLEAAAAKGVLADAAHAARCTAGALCHDDQDALEDVPCRPVEGTPKERALHLYPRAISDGELLAVPISYGNWAATIDLNCKLYRAGRYGGWEESSEVMLTLQQLLHGTGLMGSFPFLHMGLPQVFVRAFQPERVAELVERQRVTTTGMTSGMLAVLLERLPPAGLRSLRRLLYGGAPLRSSQLRCALDALGPVLVQVYGRLEGGWPLTILDQADHSAIAAGLERRAASCGRVPARGVELRVRAGGELSTRSPMASAEYCDAQGWCDLGDLAHIDADGYVFLQGRLDSMVNTGYHVYPHEVEATLRQIAGVSAARVVGEPDERRGERLAAYVVAQPGSALHPQALREALRGRLAAYKVPRVIWIVDALDAIPQAKRSEVAT
jgi:acyl-CoA synthetase (AMP-forming)/AMP-acid ligase II